MPSNSLRLPQSLGGCDEVARTCRRYRDVVERETERGGGGEKSTCCLEEEKQEKREKKGKQIKERTVIKNAELKMFQMASDI